MLMLITLQQRKNLRLNYSNTSHDNVNQLRMNNPIHLINSNTSHVNVNHIPHNINKGIMLIQIHLMLMLIRRKGVGLMKKRIFKYISC